MTTPPPADHADKATPNSKRHPLWRVVNAVFILMVFFAPWVNSCSGSSQPLNGYDATYFTWLGVLSHNFRADNPEDTWKLEALYFMVAVGLTAFLIYTAFNLVTALGPLRLTTALLWRGLNWLLLLASALGLAVGFAIAAQNGLLWGYWLAWVGLGSAIGVEVLTSRNHSKPEPTPSPPTSPP